MCSFDKLLSIFKVENYMHISPRYVKIVCANLPAIINYAVCARRPIINVCQPFNCTLSRESRYHWTFIQFNVQRAIYESERESWNTKKMCWLEAISTSSKCVAWALKLRNRREIEIRAVITLSHPLLSAHTRYAAATHNLLISSLKKKKKKENNPWHGIHNNLVD